MKLGKKEREDGKTKKRSRRKNLYIYRKRKSIRRKGLTTKRRNRKLISTKHLQR